MKKLLIALLMLPLLAFGQSVPYGALNSTQFLRAPSIPRAWLTNVSGTYGAWWGSGTNIYFSGGNVGIGTNNGVSRLHIGPENGTLGSGLTFGNGTDGIYQIADDLITIGINNARKFDFTATVFGGANGFAATMGFADATATVPGFYFRDDPNTGVGLAAPNILSFIADGVGVASITTTGVGIGTTTPATPLSVTDPATAQIRIASTNTTAINTGVRVLNDLNNSLFFFSNPSAAAGTSLAVLPDSGYFSHQGSNGLVLGTLNAAGTVRIFVGSTSAAFSSEKIQIKTTGLYLTNGAGLMFGAGTLITNIVSATAALDFGSILAAGSADLTITVAGAKVNDSVSPGPPADPDASLAFDYFVSAANTVTVRAHNVGTIAVDQASKTWRITVTQF